MSDLFFQETPPQGGCGSPQWANDNFCDDENNNPGCNFDGGACCNNQSSGWDNFCNVCACLESPPTPPPTTPSPPKGGCGSPQWVNDNFCDDENNNPGCNFDGGDCCNNQSPGWNNFCNVCACLEGGCGSPQWANDNFCDDENNNFGCNFDGGACCFNQSPGWDNFCNDCACLLNA